MAESISPAAVAIPMDPMGKIETQRAPARRHHWLVRLTHWLNAVLLVGMIGSGLQIYTAFQHFGPRGGPYYPNPMDGLAFPKGLRLGGWLAGGLNWHFALAWPFVLCGLLYLGFLVFSGEWRDLIFRPRDVPKAWRMQLYYLRLRREHPPQGKHNALQKAAYNFIFLLGALSVLTGFAVYKPIQLGWLAALFGGYELARYWHFWAVWIFVAFSLVHVALVFLVDPASLRAMITGWYRGRFPSHGA
jgi:thiosulfate reductase cytochrome b subunit